MTFGKEKRANQKYNQATNTALSVSTPKGFNIAGAGGGGFGIDLGGTPQGRGYLPFADQNLTLANSGINNLLKGFTGQNPFSNPYSQALMDLAQSEQRSQRRDLKNNLNARGQGGGSFEAMMMKGLQDNLADQLLQAKLAGFDKTLAALAGLGQSSANTQNQYLAPIELAQRGMIANNQNNISRAGIPLQLMPGIIQGELTRRSGLEQGLGQFNDLFRSLASLAQGTGNLATGLGNLSGRYNP